MAPEDAAPDSEQADADQGEPGTRKVPVGKVKPNPQQPRKTMTRLEDLVSSIKRVGLLNPITVIPGDDGTFILVGGERRLKAVKELGWKEVPAHVLDARMLKKERGGTSLGELALIENIQREDLNPVEEGEAYKDLTEQYKWTEKQLGDRLGKAQSYISDKVRLTALDDRVKKLIAEGQLSFSQAREVLRVKELPDQHKAAKQVVGENLTVLEAKALVDKLLGKPPKAAKSGTKKARAFTPKKAISSLEILDQGLRVLKPEAVKEKWRPNLLKQVTSVLQRLEELRASLEGAAPEQDEKPKPRGRRKRTGSSST